VQRKKYLRHEQSMSSCRVDLPDGRPRRLDVTAAAITARRPESVEIAIDPPDAPASSSRTREICISAGILVGILTALGVVVVVFA
jgi:hypothetical protein